jgi:Uma2 family endonuclease
MNIASPPRSLVTRAADGFDRRAFTIKDVRRMVKAGVLEDDDKIELIEGEIVWKTQAKHFPHERIKLALNRALSRALPDHLQLGVETSVYLSDITFVDPDLSIFPMMDTEQVRGSDILLAIEVAHTTLAKDLRLKAAVYAKYGVREYWVIDAKKLVTHVHSAPKDGAWSTIRVSGPHDILKHGTAPGFALRLADL